MWPTDTTLPYLLLGVAPLAYVIVDGVRHGLQRMASLESAAILFLWIGYHLTPWLSFARSGWESFLLEPDYIDEGLLFSSLCMVFLLVGYRVGLRYFAGREKSEAVGQKKLVRSLVPRVRERWLLLFLALSVALFVQETGSVQEAWHSRYSRQWWYDAGNIYRARSAFLVGILTGVTNWVLAILASLYMVAGKMWKRVVPGTYIIGYFCLLIASLTSMHSFSRAVGLPLFVLAFVLLRVKGARAWLSVVMLSLLGYWMGYVALANRPNRNPGVGSYLQALASSITQGSEMSLRDESRNPVNAMDAWTLKARSAELERVDHARSTLALIWNLHPFPSFILPVYPIGSTLTELKGTIGAVGLTTPALGELYYAAYLWGCFLMVTIGFQFSFFDVKSRYHPTPLLFVCVVLCFLSIPLGLHNDMRAMTRPLVYSLLAYLVYWWRSNRSGTLEARSAGAVDLSSVGSGRKGTR
jgi:hypothetical protein